MAAKTQMRREIIEIPAAVETLLSHGQAGMTSTARALAERDPALMISVALGSSDHAATYFKYTSELVAGIPVASVGPSVASIYGRDLKLRSSACIAVSQSCKSPDRVRMAKMVRRQGALCIAMTNHPESALAQASCHTLNLHAGAEISIASTKTFVTSIVCTIWLLAEWRKDAELLAAIRQLPAALEKAAAADWSVLVAQTAARQSLYCLGHGPALAVSNEASLKFKETCQLHAESYSSAEVLHGLVSIVDKGFPVLALCAADRAQQALADVADALADKGAVVFATADRVKRAARLETVRTTHPLTDAIALVVSFYALAEQTARTRGVNPDKPCHLKKVMETV